MIMDLLDLYIGMQCHLTAMDDSVYVITEFIDGPFPIGVAEHPKTKTEFFVRPISVHLLRIVGHTHN